MRIESNGGLRYPAGNDATLMGDILKNQGSHAAGSKAGTKSEELKKLLHNLNKKQEEENPYSATSVYKEQGYLDLTGKTEKSKSSKTKSKTHYNYKDVSNKIRRAKTALSAGQAVIAAKRKVVEIRRRIAGGKEEAEELQLALTHAKRVEMAARKKKHHLELEELVEATKKREEAWEKSEETSSQIEEGAIDQAQEQVEEEEDAIFSKRGEMTEELGDIIDGKEAVNEQMTAEADNASVEKMMTELNQMIADFGEEELKKLEEEMEQLEGLEAVDPHMSEEELAKLKLKHRNAENKALMKADMDYLKGMIRHVLAKGSSFSTKAISGSLVGMGGHSLMGSGSGASGQVFSVNVSVGAEDTYATGCIPAADLPSAEAPSVDVQI